MNTRRSHGAAVGMLLFRRTLTLFLPVVFSANSTISGALLFGENTTASIPRAALPLPVSNSAAESAPEQQFHVLDELLKLMPDQLGLMRHLLTLATSSSDTLVRVEALLVLQELVEDLDKAEDFRKIDGFEPIVQLLALPIDPSASQQLAEEQLRVAEAAAWVIGTAAQNQRPLQLYLISLHALTLLSDLLRVHKGAAGVEAESAKAKAVYALSALLRNCPEGQRRCEEVGCYQAMIEALLNSGPRAARKALVLLSELMHESLAAAAAKASGRPTYDSHPHAIRSPTPFWRGTDFKQVIRLCRAVLSHLPLSAEERSSEAGTEAGTSSSVAVGDVDTQEKAVLALKHMHAAGLVRSFSGKSDARTAEEERGLGTDRWCDERVTGRLQAVIDSCQQLAREAVKGNGGEATAAATTTDCIELLPLARSLQRSLADADGRPADSPGLRAVAATATGLRDLSL